MLEHLRLNFTLKPCVCMSSQLVCHIFLVRCGTLELFMHNTYLNKIMPSSIPLSHVAFRLLAYTYPEVCCRMCCKHTQLESFSLVYVIICIGESVSTCRDSQPCGWTLFWGSGVVLFQGKNREGLGLGTLIT